MKEFNTLPQVALQKAHDVLSMYLTLMAESREVIDWTCEEEYAVEVPEAQTGHHQGNLPFLQPLHTNPLATFFGFMRRLNQVRHEILLKVKPLGCFPS